MTLGVFKKKKLSRVPTQTEEMRGTESSMFNKSDKLDPNGSGFEESLIDFCLITR